jgi:hypothetical protein
LFAEVSANIVPKGIPIDSQKKNAKRRKGRKPRPDRDSDGM